jgi:hypothetical protein
MTGVCGVKIVMSSSQDKIELTTLRAEPPLWSAGPEKKGAEKPLLAE